MRAFKITDGIDDNTYMVGLEDNIYDLITPYYLNGSYNIVAARVLGFSYPDYLRFVRDNYNATLKGNAGYSYAIYKNRNDCYDIVKLLNEFWNKIEKDLKEKLTNNQEEEEENVI